MPRARATSGRGRIIVGLPLCVPIVVVLALSSCTSKSPGAADASGSVAPSVSDSDGAIAVDPSTVATSSSTTVAGPSSSTDPTPSSVVDAPSSTTINVYAAAGTSGMSPAVANAKSYV